MAVLTVSYQLILAIGILRKLRLELIGSLTTDSTILDTQNQSRLKFKE